MVLLQYGSADDTYYYKSGQRVTITKVSTTGSYRGSSTIDYYKTDNGVIVGVTDKIIVKLNSDSDIKKYLDEFNATIEKELGKNLYLLKAENKRLTIDISNRLSEKNGVEYAHPDFIKKRVSR
ncbi:MAG: hypothetical protein NTW78_12640 [Campylobacterales bacterium]|nr:hypothetical protein [Campylobacterales bacterium]